MTPWHALSLYSFFENHWNANHVNRDGMLSGLDQLMGVLGVTISTDKVSYKIGERPTYRISGGTPKGYIAWSSYRNGKNTGEFQADYGNSLNDFGSFTIQGDAWKSSDVGDWEKEILIVPENYDGDESKLAVGKVGFSVSSAAASSSQLSSKTPNTGVLNQKVNVPVLGQVSVLYLIGGGIGLFFLLNSGKRK